MEKEEAALTVTEQQPVWPRCTFHLRRGNGTHAKLKKYILSKNYRNTKIHNLTNTHSQTGPVWPRCTFHKNTPFGL